MVSSFKGADLANNQTGSTMPTTHASYLKALERYKKLPGHVKAGNVVIHVAAKKCTFQLPDIGGNCRMSEPAMVEFMVATEAHPGPDGADEAFLTKRGKDFIAARKVAKLHATVAPQRAKKRKVEELDPADARILANEVFGDLATADKNLRALTKKLYHSVNLVVTAPEQGTAGRPSRRKQDLVPPEVILVDLSNNDDDDEKDNSNAKRRRHVVINLAEESIAKLPGTSNAIISVKEKVMNLAKNKEHKELQVEMYGKYEPCLNGTVPIGKRGAHVEDKKKSFIGAIIKVAIGIQDMRLMLPQNRTDDDDLVKVTQHDKRKRELMSDEELIADQRIRMNPAIARGRIEDQRKYLIKVVFAYAALISRVWKTLQEIDVHNEEDLFVYLSEHGLSDEFRALLEMVLPLCKPNVHITEDTIKELSNDAFQMYMSLCEGIALEVGDLAIEQGDEDDNDEYDEHDVPIHGDDTEDDDSSDDDDSGHKDDWLVLDDNIPFNILRILMKTSDKAIEDLQDVVEGKMTWRVFEDKHRKNMDEDEFDNVKDATKDYIASYIAAKGHVGPSTSSY